MEIQSEIIQSMTRDKLLSPIVMDELYNIPGDIEHARKKTELMALAKDLKCKAEFMLLCKEYDKERKMRRTAEIESRARDAAEETSSSMTVFNHPHHPELCCGKWQADGSGVKYETPKGIQLACRHPIMPVRRHISLETGDEKMDIAFKKNGHWVEHIFPKSAMYDHTQLTKMLADKGAIITTTTAKNLTEYLADVEQLNMAVIETVKSTSKLGWKNGIQEFVFPDSNEITIENRDAFQHLYKAITTRGSKDAYIKFIKRARQLGRFEIFFISAAALASVIVEPCGCLPFMAHLYGEAGKGKTLCSKLAASFWGDPSTGAYLSDPKATPVAHELRLDALHNLPFVIDDISQVKMGFVEKGKSAYSEFIYMLCSGQGKHRGTKNLGNERQRTWRNISITNGERQITDDNSQGGEILRVIDLQIDEGDIFPDGGKTADFMERCHGHIGRIFVEAVRGMGIDALKAEFKRNEDAIRARPDSDSMEGKQVKSMALLLTADSILHNEILQDGLLMDFERACSMIKTNSQMSENERAYEFIMSEVARFRRAYQPSDDGFKEDKSERMGHLWRCKEDDKEYVLINPNVFKSMCENGNFSKKLFLSWAYKKNIAKMNEPRLDLYVKSGDIKGRFICIQMPEDDAAQK